VNKSEDIAKLMTMDKQEIINYYEGLLDKCHETLLVKRNSIRNLKQVKLSLQFQLSRTQRMNTELVNQVE
jgi:hypothetical protein